MKTTDHSRSRTGDVHRFASPPRLASRRQLAGVRAMLLMVSLVCVAAKTDSCTWDISTTGTLDRTQETDCLAADGGMFDCTATAPASTTTTPTTPTDTGGTDAVVELGVTVSPAVVTLGPNMSRQFTATVVGSDNTSVVWQFVGTAPTDVTLDQTGTVTVGTSGPGTGSATLRAVSLADGTTHGDASLTFTTESLSISPPSAKLNTNGSLQFTGTDSVSGNQTAWSVVESGGGSIDPIDGTYVAPPYVGTYHVRLTSAGTPTLYALAKVTVQSGALPTVTLSPAVATLTAYSSSTAPGDTLRVTATVANDTDSEVTWSLDKGTCGTSLTNTDGTVSSAGTTTCADAKLTATSKDDPAAFASMPITVVSADDNIFTVHGQVKLAAGVLPAGATSMGPVFVAVSGDYSGSTMVPSVTTTASDFVVRAVSQGGICSLGSVAVQAWVDLAGTRTFLPAVDPTASGTAIFTCATDHSASLTSALSLDFTTPGNPATPTNLFAAGLDTGLMVTWKGSLTSSGFEKADHYTIYAKKAPTSTSTCDATTVGQNVTNDKVLTLPAGLGDMGFLTGLTNGLYYCIAVAARAGTYASAPVFTPTAVEAGGPSGNQTNNAEIDVNYGKLLSNFSSTSMAALYTIAQGNDDQVHLARETAANQSVSAFINDLANGGYRTSAAIDVNGDGYIGPDEPQFFTSFIPIFDVAGASPAPLAVTMLDAERLVAANTVTYDDTGTTKYRIELVASPNRKSLLAARVDSMTGGSSPALSSPVDLAFRGISLGSPQFGVDIDVSSQPPQSSTFHFLLTDRDGAVTEATVSGIATVGEPTGLAVAAADKYSSKYLSPLATSTTNPTSDCAGTCGAGATLTPAITNNSTPGDSYLVATTYCFKITTSGTKFEWASSTGASCSGVTWNTPDQTITTTATVFDGTNNAHLQVTFGTGAFIDDDVYSFRVTPNITIKPTAEFDWVSPDGNPHGYELDLGPGAGVTGLNGVSVYTKSSSIALSQLGASGLEAGDYSATVRAYDTAGNTGISAALAVSVPELK